MSIFALMQIAFQPALILIAYSLTWQANSGSSSRAPGVGVHARYRYTLEMGLLVSLPFSPNDMHRREIS